MTKYGSYLKYVALGLATLFFLFFISRKLRHREREEFAGEPTWLTELDAPRRLAAIEGGADEATDLMQLRAPVNDTRRQIEELVERDPDRVAQQVRAWMSED